MRYGVLADIHSNLEALTACLAALRERGAQAYVVCGDSVGYGPDPLAVLERLSRLKPLYAVLGNHDLAALGRMDVRWFNSYARAALEWTAGRLTGSARGFLGSLPLKLETPAFTLVHGSPRDPAEEYLLTPRQFLENLQSFKVSPCFIGHSHLPLYFQSLGAKGPRVAHDVLQGEARWEVGPLPCALNPGSVGQPRDADPRAACAIYDSRERSFQMIRAAYPIEETRSKILAAGLPRFLADRLESGR